MALFEDHVEIVDHQAIADFALRHHTERAKAQGTWGRPE